MPSDRLISVRRKAGRLSGCMELTLLAIWLPMMSPTSRTVLGHVWLGYSEKVEVVVRNGEFELSACGPNARTIVRLGGAASWWRHGLMSTAHYGTSRTWINNITSKGIYTI